MTATLNINKAVSLSFDEDPEIRKHAAEMLGKLDDDPAAVFALVELSYDKDTSVRELAQKLLDKKKSSEPELMSFAEIFSSGAKKSETEEEPSTSKDRVLLPITRIFEKRLGKEKAELVRSKMMPSIERIYQKAMTQKTGKKTEGKKAMQEFLTSYLEVMSDLDRVGNGDQIQIEAELSTDLETVGKPEQFDNISTEIASLEAQNIEEVKQQQGIEGLPDTYFKKAFEVMMLSNGDDKIMKREMKNMLQAAKKEIELAFKLAKTRFKEENITHLTEIKDRMRNINTEPLIVASVENMEYQKTKKQKAALTRLLVHDEDGNEGVVYLFDDRGLVVNPGMKIKVVKGTAKSFKFSGETALTLGRKGSIYIVL
ncbi:HEAT repeat domain-containing protein [Candidatus Micrarchaeota archaeon]|nr:HEAT repeat domain-containing protein [Candidatus Micrarchaeota archaeon]